MSAGQPNWQRLYEMGKLPKEMRDKIALLPQLDAAQAKIEEIRARVCMECAQKIFGGVVAPNSDGSVTIDDASGITEVSAASSTTIFTAKCLVEGCTHVAEGKSQARADNYLRLHSRTHEEKKTE